MIKSHRMRSPALVFGLVVPLAAFGQSPAEDYVLVGAGLRARPAYDGSDSQRGELIPVLRYYGRPWFARTTQGVLEGGARVELAPGLNLGVQLAYEGGRAASESGFLRSPSACMPNGTGSSARSRSRCLRARGGTRTPIWARRPTCGSPPGSTPKEAFLPEHSPRRRGRTRNRSSPSTALRRSSRQRPGSRYLMREADPCLRASDFSGRWT